LLIQSLSLTALANEGVSILYCGHRYPAAEAEHLETVAYYESKRLGLGTIYLVEFENILKGICDTPQRYPIEINLIYKGGE
jgi:hypothetical protein